MAILRILERSQYTLSRSRGSTESSWGIFHDVAESIIASGDYIAKPNDNPKPFVWTAKAPEVLEEVKHAHAALDKPTLFRACRSLRRVRGR